MTKAEEIIYFHERTKHHPHRFAPSLGYLDWEEQPNPFRFYEGVSRLPLARDLPDPQVNFPALYTEKNIPISPLDKNSLSQFLSLSLALSAWKAVGQNSWSLRVNPSSGNLHPTEAHLWVPTLGDLQGGCYHYTPLLHSLETRCHSPLTADLTNGFIIGLSSIYWRESWKYGERGFRYCQHDIGHAISALSYAARTLGWKINRLPLSDPEFESLFGFNQVTWVKTEEEKPDLALFVSLEEKFPTRVEIKDWVQKAESFSFIGVPKPLSKNPLPWEEISKISVATKRNSFEIESPLPKKNTTFENPYPVTKLASDIIKSRRSAVDFDGHTTVSKEAFLTFLEYTLPSFSNPTFPNNMKMHEVNLFLFVHRVEGLTPGLYAYLRDGELEKQKSLLHPDFSWQEMADGSPLYLLKEGDFQADAKAVSCNQDIAADGAFSLSMVAYFERNVSKNPHAYRELFWETGMIGQSFYLNAEAFLVRATGIGCFFDDLMHGVLGLKGLNCQSLYHLSIGGPVEDPRLSTLPPYAHLD